MKTIDSFNFNNKKAIIRVDFNVPLDENFKVTDATRIEAAKPTIDKIIADAGSVILMSHLGRPKGVEAKYSLKHILEKCSEILEIDVKFAENCIGQEARTAADNLKNGEVLLLENLRFHDEEEAGDVRIRAACVPIAHLGKERRPPRRAGGRPRRALRPGRLRLARVRRGRAARPAPNSSMKPWTYWKLKYALPAMV